MPENNNDFIASWSKDVARKMNDFQLVAGASILLREMLNRHMVRDKDHSVFHATIHAIGDKIRQFTNQ